MPNALQNPQHDDYGTPEDSLEGRLDEIEAIARETESKCRSWNWLQSLSGRVDGGRVAAILYPGTMAGAASLVHRLESAGIPWQSLDAARLSSQSDSSGTAAISLRIVDERLIFDGERIRVHAGYSVSALAHAADSRGLLGIEFLGEVSGSLGSIMRRSYDGHIWRVVDEVVVARHGAIKVIATHGEVLTNEERTILESGLILAVTLRLIKADRDALRLAGELRRDIDDGSIHDAFPDNEAESKAVEVRNVTGEVIPLTDRMRERTPTALDLELEYDVDVWRDETEEKL